jgi:DNA-binding HxlR family transcriptional regulator
MKNYDIPEALTVKLRIKIVSCLIQSSKTFNEILEKTEASKGNISTQLTKLENWGYLTSKKVIEKKKTKTTYTLTEFGLKQFEEYVSFLQNVLLGIENDDE